MEQQKALKIQICIPSSDKPELETFATMVNAMQHAIRTTPHQYNLVYGKRMFIHFARKAMVEAALEAKADYMIFLDDDMVFPANTITRLIAASQKYDLDCVSGLYCRRGAPFEPFIMIRQGETDVHSFFMPKPDQRNTLIRCDASGFGCCLFRPQVFEKIEKPWFELPDNMTEDTYFFRKANWAGLEVHVDAGLTCGHIGSKGIVFPYRTEFSDSVANGYHKVYAEDFLNENHLIEEKKDESAA